MNHVMLHCSMFFELNKYSSISNSYGATSLQHFKIVWWDIIKHYSDLIIGAMASQITSVSIIYLTISSAGDQRKHQSSALLAFVRGNPRWTANYPHKGPVTRKMLPLGDVVMILWSHVVRLLCSLIQILAWWQSDCQWGMKYVLILDGITLLCFGLNVTWDCLCRI